MSRLRVSFFLCFLFFTSYIFSVDLTFKLTPVAEFPFVTTEAKRYGDFGGGGFADFGADLFDFLNVGVELGYIVLPKENSENIVTSTGGANVDFSTDNTNGEDKTVDKIVSFIPVGVQLGLFFYPFSRLETSLGVAGGACISISDGLNHYAPWYRAFGEIGYRINPNLSVSGNVSWLITQDNSWWGNPGSSGLTAGVSVKYKLDTKKSARNVYSTAEFADSVFPVFYTVYREAPFGTLTIHNTETAEIRNLKVSFRADKYTASETLCGTVRQIRRRKSVQVPIVADWSSSILQFSEEGKLPGEIVIEYDFLGKKKKTAVSEVIIPVYNRNQMRWEDPSSIASFISPQSQEVLEFSKVLVGIARNYLRSGLNRNMQFAMFLFDGMALSGIECRENLDTPYAKYHLQPQMIDYIQYPFQTMQFLSGDKDDIAVLFMALLESVGISAGFIPLDNDVIVCFNLGLDASRVDSFFNGDEKVLFIDDEVWIPLSMSNMREGFVNSWYNALKEIEEADDLEFVLLSDAWQTYPPSGYSSNTSLSMALNEKKLISSVETDLARYVTAEIGPKVVELQDRIKTEGAKVELYNQLGLLYVRAGMYPSAKSVYEVSARAGSVSAMNNLGNICSLLKEFDEAKKWYRLALQYEPDNATAIKNLSRLENDME